MFEKVSQIAEQAATNVSRRRFLGKVGRGAAVTVAALGGLLAISSEAVAGRPCTRGYYKCGVNPKTQEVVCCLRGKRGGKKK